MSEEWRRVQGVDNYYEVSNLARVRNARGRLLKPSEHLGGYLRIFFWDSKRYVSINKLLHLVVAEAFLGPKPDGHQVNHLDGNKANNNPENLEYVTPKGNMRHFHHVLGGHTKDPVLLDEAQRDAIRQSPGGKQLVDLAKRLNVSMTTIQRVRRTRRMDCPAARLSVAG